jgi:hypothetical protein
MFRSVLLNFVIGYDLQVGLYYIALNIWIIVWIDLHLCIVC